MRRRLLANEGDVVDWHDGDLFVAHEFDQDSIDAVNAALASRRPLLVRGEPGVGKSQLARAAAASLGFSFVKAVVDSRTRAADFLYTIDAVARLAEAQLVGALPRGTADAIRSDRTVSKPESAANALRDLLDESRFVRPGPLWWAISPGKAEKYVNRSRGARDLRTVIGDAGTVLLIDEIDKGDADVPNGLLDVLGQREFTCPGEPAGVRAEGVFPLVIITTNRERELPWPFVRRCLTLQLELPSGEDLVELLVRRGSHHFPETAESVLREAATQLVEDRSRARARGISRLPGLAEYLDLLRALTDGGSTEAEQLADLESISRFVFDKHHLRSPRAKLGSDEPDGGH